MKTSEFIRIEIPAAMRHLSVLSACIAELLGMAQNLPDPATKIYRCQLAVQEIGTNIVEHAYASEADKRIWVAFWLFPQKFVVEFEDNGKTFDPASIQPSKAGEKPRDPNLPQERGFGLHVARQLVDELIYETTENRNIWRLVVRW